MSGPRPASPVRVRLRQVSRSSDDLAPPLLLIPGTGGTVASNYSPIMDELAERHLVLGVDIMATDGEDLTLDEILDAITNALIENGIRQPVNLVGYSLGAVIAAALAARLLDRVSHLVLLGGWARTDSQRLLRNQLWLDLNETDPQLLAKYWVLSSYGPHHLASLAEADVDALVSQTRVRPGTVAQMKLNRALDIRERLAHIRARTLVVGGESDQTIPFSHSRELAAGIPGARLHMLLTGHAFMAERPDEVIALINTHIRPEPPSQHANARSESPQT